MGIFIGNKRIAPVKILKTGGEYNIEPILETDENGKVTQTLKITDWDYVPKPSFDPVFANNSWTQIAEASEIIKANNYTSAQVKEIFGWDLQTDTKVDIGKDGVSRTFHFLGFNHDDLSDETGKAGITLGTVNCEPVQYALNPTHTNRGGYAATQLKNSTLPTILTLLSDELQSVIKNVNKKSANGNSETGYTETLTLSEDLFLLSQIEVLGVVTTAQDGENEGSLYEFWNGKASTDRIKYYDADGDGIAETKIMWYLRSCYNRFSAAFCGVSTSGTAGAADAENARGIAYALCI